MRNILFAAALLLLALMGCAQVHHDHPAPGFCIATNVAGRFVGMYESTGRTLSYMRYTRQDAIDDTWPAYYSGQSDKWYPEQPLTPEQP